MRRKRIQFSEFEELEVKNLSYKCREIGGGCGREMVIRSEYNSVSRHLVSPPCLPIKGHLLSKKHMLLYFPDSASSRCALELWILKEGWFTEKANSLELACWQKRTSLVEMSWILSHEGWHPVTMIVTSAKSPPLVTVFGKFVLKTCFRGWGFGEKLKSVENVFL